MQLSDLALARLRNEALRPLRTTSRQAKTARHRCDPRVIGGLRSWRLRPSTNTLSVQTHCGNCDRDGGHILCGRQAAVVHQMCLRHESREVHRDDDVPQTLSRNRYSVTSDMSMRRVADVHKSRRTSVHDNIQLAKTSTDGRFVSSKHQE
jgi:hypothetical protein